MKRAQKVVIVGAGIGGLVAALQLAANGVDTILVESAPTPGGKMRQVLAGGAAIDAGPTVFTMRWVFDEILEAVGASLSDLVVLRSVETLARHAWSETERLDLFADVGRSADAIGVFAGKAEADGYLSFCKRARATYETLLTPFIRASKPNPFSLVSRVGPGGVGALIGISPFTTLATALGDHFADPRLRQLFGRYATYCGSSPYRAPATLMLVAHVEQEGVWIVEGGMVRLANALAHLARAKGVAFHYGERVTRVLTESGRASGVQLSNGERIAADAVLMNGDVAALATGLLGADVVASAPPTPRASRSLSAITWAMAARTEGFGLTRHNVFFSRDYRAEFDEIFARGRLPGAPTVYVCAQDRDGGADQAADSVGAERLLCLVNAPANGDLKPFDDRELQSCERATFALLARCGLNIKTIPEATVRTLPADFERLFPGTGGALYGRASHGWMASFARPGARTKLPGLYLAGGSVHPGPGAPMAALSGRLAASTMMADLASTNRWFPAAMPGGISTR